VTVDHYRKVIKEQMAILILEWDYREKDLYDLADEAIEELRK
jgi:hypothetical protein